MDGVHHVVRYRASKRTEKDLFHVLILGSCPLGHKQDALLEVPNLQVHWHGHKPMIQLVITSCYTACRPFHSVVLEHALVQLMQNIWCDAGEDVAVQEV